MTRKIDILIDNAKIRSFHCALNETIPEISVNIDLYAGKTKVSDFNLSSESWRTQHFDVPAKMIEPIKKIASQLEEIVTLHCSSALGQLPENTNG